MASTRGLTALLCLSLWVLPGCRAQQLQNDALEEVAKNWCLTIRASQVIPVYPLTEDLQPGDVFLVQVPIDRQQDLYQEKGFLALDNHLYRLPLDDDPGASPPLVDPYTPFYDRSFGPLNAGEQLPGAWLEPGDDAGAWALAPDAAFPSYKFSVRSGGGFNLALPVNGIPVGLSLMGSDAAQGSILIADANTYGVDIFGMWQHLAAWAQDPGVRQFLARYAETTRDVEGRREVNYLRVVTRVYLTRRLDISLSDAESMAAGLDVGAAKPVELLVTTPGADPNAVTAQSYSDNLQNLNDRLDEIRGQVDPAGNLLPGGSIRVVAASAGSITLQETFDRPQVIGYLGFDVAILPGGELGSPIPTHAYLQGEVEPVTLDWAPEERRYRDLAVQVRRHDRADQVRGYIVSQIGGDLSARYEAAPARRRAGIFADGMDRYLSHDRPGYWLRLDSAIDLFEEALERSYDAPGDG